MNRSSANQVIILRRNTFIILTILIGAMAAIFIAFNLFEKKEKYGVVSYKTIALSVTYVILAVIVGSFLDNFNTLFQGFHDSLTAAKRY